MHSRFAASRAINQKGFACSHDLFDIQNLSNIFQVYNTRKHTHAHTRVMHYIFSIGIHIY